jgi:hypothetical protein
MISYKFTIEGKITAANATKAYAALTEMFTRIADSLGPEEPQIELKEEIRITLLPLPGSQPVAGPGLRTCPASGRYGRRGQHKITSAFGSTDG